jgi:hypothetical protein
MGLAAFIALFFLVPDGATPWVLVANLATFYALFIRAITGPDRLLPRLPSYLTVEVLFFAYSYLIFYYPYQLFVLGATDLRVSRYVSNSFVDGSNKAITLTTIGMLAFTIGHRILGRADRLGADDADLKRPDRGEDGRRSRFRPLAIASSALLLMLVAIYLLAGWRSAGEGRYTGTTTNALGIEGMSTAVLVLCMMVAALWVYARANALDTPPILMIGLLVTVGWAVRLLVLGDRNSFLLIALVLVGGYFTFVRRASLIVIAGSFGVWILLYYAIEVLRTIPNWYRTGNFVQALEYSQYQQGSSGENSFNVTTITLRATVEVIPDGHDFMYGVLKIIQASSAIPFSGKLYLPYLEPEYANSAEMLTEILLGRRATWGTGTNVISDSYVDFGVLGVVAIMFALGLSAKAIRNYVARDPYDPHRVVMYLLALALFAELPRYAIEVPIRFLAWAFILSMIVKATAGRLQKRQGPGTTSTRPKTSTTTEGFVARSQQDRQRTPFVVQSANHQDPPSE